MQTQLKKLGDAELEIMQVIWECGGEITSGSILERLKGRRNWQQSTLMTSLGRLSDKGFVKCDRSGRHNYYSALVSETEYKAGAGGSFLKKLYNNSLGNMVATLYGSRIIGDDDIKELREYLDRLERDENG